MPAIARAKIGTARDRDAAYLLRVRYGPREPIRRTKVRHHKIERCRNSGCLYQFVDKTRHSVQRALEIGRGRRASKPRQVGSEAMIGVFELLDHTVPHLSRIGSSVQEERRRAR